MNLETLDALVARLTRPELWDLVTERQRLAQAPTSALLLLEVTPYDRVEERYGAAASHYASTFSTSLVDVSSQSLLWRQDRLSDLLAGWVPSVDGARMGRVVPYTEPRLVPPDPTVPGGVQYQCTALWSLSGDRATLEKG